MDLSLIWPSSSGFPDQYAACLPPVQNKAFRICLKWNYKPFFIPGPPQRYQHLKRRMWADPDPKTKVLNIKLQDQNQDSTLGLYSPVHIPSVSSSPTALCHRITQWDFCSSQPLLSPLRKYRTSSLSCTRINNHLYHKLIIIDADIIKGWYFFHWVSILQIINKLNPNCP